LSINNFDLRKRKVR